MSKNKQHLPLLEQPSGSLHADGSRNWVQPADVRGRFTRLRFALFAVLIGVYAAMPWIRINGHPAIFLDIDHRRFHLFGQTFNAQDAWLVFFLLTGIGFALVVVTTLWGRVWCGYACPQTVFLEGVYRRIERLLEGPRNERIRRNAGPMTASVVVRKVAKHAAFLLVSSTVAHVFLSYFVSLPSMVRMVLGAPGDHPEAFLWATAITLILYGNFAWFREQLCLVVCPYGRLQSLMVDRSTMVIGYDATRGEPRGKVSDSGAGDCVACNRCVVVCPTGIDIRNGLQIECIGCAACVDACDEVMAKVGRDPGLVRYDSLEGLDGEKRRFWRPRLGLYVVLGVIGLVAATLAFSSRESFEANVLRLRGDPYVLDGSTVRNAFEIHLVNKGPDPRTYGIEIPEVEGLSFALSMPEVRLDSLEGRRVPLFVTHSRGASHPKNVALRVVSDDPSEAPRTLHVTILGP